MPSCFCCFPSAKLTKAAYKILNLTPQVLPLLFIFTFFAILITIIDFLLTSIMPDYTRALLRKETLHISLSSINTLNL